MINKRQLRDLIRRTLRKYNLYSENAEFLVACTIAQESHFGTYLRQNVKKFKYSKHGLGIGQMEKNTFRWIKEKYGRDFGFENRKFKELEYDLEFSILLTRLRYRAVRNPLPYRNNLDAVWMYYKRYYNSFYGSATKKQFLKNYEKYVG